ncbi:hypothetical protein PMm318_A42370 [Pseudomonas moorei]
MALCKIEDFFIQMMQGCRDYVLDAALLNYVTVLYQINDLANAIKGQQWFATLKLNGEYRGGRLKHSIDCQCSMLS